MPTGKVTFELSADEAKAVRAFMRVEDREKKLEERTKALAEKTKKMNQAGRKGTRDWTAELKTMALGYIGVGTAIGMARKALEDLNKESKDAAEGLKGNEFAGGKLAQMSGGDPKKMKQMMGQVRKTIDTTGMPFAKAAGLQATLESVGLSDKRELFAKMYGVVEDPSLMAKNVSIVKAAMGEKETGSAENILNKMFAASHKSNVMIDKFSPGLSAAAQQAKSIGTTDEELMAAIAISSNALTSPSTAGEQVGALSTAFARRGIESGGIMKNVTDLSAKGLSQAELIKYLGGEQAFQGYQSLLGQKKEVLDLKSHLDKVDRETGKNRDLTKNIIHSRDAIPELKVARDTAIAQGSLRNVQEEMFGLDALKREQIIHQRNREALEGGEGTIPRLARKGAMEGADYVQAPSSAVGAIGDVAAARARDLATPKLPGGMDPGIIINVFEKLYDAVTKNTEATRENSNAAKPPVGALGREPGGE